MKQDQLFTIKPILVILNIQLIKWISDKLNFEFMDLDNFPSSLRFVLRDILEVGSSAPFRNYYQWVSTSVYEYAVKNNIKEIVELGAGGAPITRCLINKYPDWDVTFKISDLNPDISTFKSLEDSDKRVVAIYTPLDFTKKMNSFQNSLLVLSAAFHHVPEKNRRASLNGLKALSKHVMLFEPVCPQIASVLLNLGILITGVLTPLIRINSKSFFRSVVWCWLIPIASILLLWDGTVSALRCWSKQEWQFNEPEAEITESLFCAKILLKK